MAINLSGQAIKDVRVAGAQAQRVMLGTGSTAVEVWSASNYPLTGTWGPLTMNEYSMTTRASHTIIESGMFTITHVGTVPQDARVNIVTPSGTTTGGQAPGGGGTSIATTTVALSVGAVVQFQASGYGRNASGTWTITKIPPPVVTITGTIGSTSQAQFRAACTQYGVDYRTVQELPFLLDTSQATNLSNMFSGCSSLTTVPDLTTGQVTDTSYMFSGCSSLTDGNVRCIGRHPTWVNTFNMIYMSGLTREPFYDTNGNPI